MVRGIEGSLAIYLHYGFTAEYFFLKIARSWWRCSFDIDYFDSNECVRHQKSSVFTLIFFLSIFALFNPLFLHLFFISFLCFSRLFSLFFFSFSLFRSVFLAFFSFSFSQFKNMKRLRKLNANCESSLQNLCAFVFIAANKELIKELKPMNVLKIELAKT